jgi:hypothetical protein
MIKAHEVKRVGAKLKDLNARLEKLEESVAALTEAFDNLPLDQLQAVYESEKQFQEGLNAILTYGSQNFGLNKEKLPHEH